MMRGVILYGPPAAGKDTITEALHKLDARYALFPRLKVGTGRAAGYRMTTEAAMQALRASGEIVWENRRYDALYAVDRTSLREHLASSVPVLHLGQAEAIDAITSAIAETRWLVVYVWCPRDIAEERILARQTGDLEARLRAWDDTNPIKHADVRINTAEVLPDHAARRIHHRLL
jgi:guanylate kinase